MAKQLTADEFVKKAISLHGHKYGYRQIKYTNNRTKVTIACPDHGNFEQSPNSHLNGNGCKQCYFLRAGENARTDRDSFINKAQKRHPDKYVYEKVVYINNCTAVAITCLTHGEFHQTPASHLRGSGCPSCLRNFLRNKFSFSKEKFVQKANKIHAGLYDYSKTIYINAHLKVDIGCFKHGDFKQKPIRHLTGQGCPTCKASKGELVIAAVLNKNNIKFIPQYRLPGNQNLFRYDFYLPETDILIEFHGIQHFKAIDFFGGEEGLSQTKIRDKFKIDLAKLNRKKLVQFTYKDLQLAESEFEGLVLKSIIKHKRSKMNSILANRPMSGFPVSVATSLALETLFTPTIAVADESRDVPEKVDPSTYDLYLFNVSTVLRNLIQSLPWRDMATVARRDVADAFLEEIDFLTGFFQAANLPLKFYWNSYSYALKTYPDKIRKPTTPQQLSVMALTDYCTSLVRKQDEVLSFSKDLVVSREAKCLLVSHVPWDLLSYGNFHRLDLLESHTGRIKSRKDWNSKYYPLKEHDLSFLPFMEYLLSVLGDSVMFTPAPLKERVQLWETLKKKRVHPLMSELSLSFMLGKG